MAYTQPTTRNTGDSITASVWNTDLVDNLIAIKNPPTDSYVADEGADWTTTSTSFVDVDGTDLSLTITTTGGDVIVHFHGVFLMSFNSDIVKLNVSLDGVNVAADDGITGASFYNSASALKLPISFTRLITGVSAGSHTFKLRWKVAANSVTLYAGAGTTNFDFHPQFWVREMS